MKRFMCKKFIHILKEKRNAAKHHQLFITLSSDVFCHLLLIMFANCVGPDQARHVVEPGLDPNCLTLWYS